MNKPSVAAESGRTNDSSGGCLCPKGVSYVTRDQPLITRDPEYSTAARNRGNVRKPTTVQSLPYARLESSSPRCRNALVFSLCVGRSGSGCERWVQVTSRRSFRSQEQTQSTETSVLCSTAYCTAGSGRFAGAAILRFARITSGGTGSDASRARVDEWAA